MRQFFKAFKKNILNLIVQTFGIQFSNFKNEFVIKNNDGGKKVLQERTY
jgi:hypothetical protein